MTYLSCPSCGTTYFDRNPLTSPYRCPRCASISGKDVELHRVRKHGAAASLLAPAVPPRAEPAPAVSDDSEERDATDWPPGEQLPT